MSSDAGQQITSYSALLGQVIGSLRQRAGIDLDQRQMAEALGLSQASYSRLEGGKAHWSIDQLMQASQILGISVQEILGILERRAADIEETTDIRVIPAGRANSRGGEANKGVSGGTLLAGAALGALLATLISKK